MVSLGSASPASSRDFLAGQPTLGCHQAACRRNQDRAVLMVASVSARSRLEVVQFCASDARQGADHACYALTCLRLRLCVFVVDHMAVVIWPSAFEACRKGHGRQRSPVPHAAVLGKPIAVRRPLPREALRRPVGMGLLRPRSTSAAGAGACAARAPMSGSGTTCCSSNRRRSDTPPRARYPRTP